MGYEIGRAQGTAQNHALARLAGFAWQVDQVFEGLRAHGVTVTVPAIDESSMVADLKNGAGQ